MWGVPRSALWISAAILAAAVAGVIAWQARMPSSSTGTAATPVAPTGGSQVASSMAPKPEPTVATVEPVPVPPVPVPPVLVPPALVPPAPVAAANVAPKDEQSANLAPTIVPAAKNPAMVPQFDVVRVEPDGSAVIAGRAAPSAAVVLLDRGQPFDRATADGAGQFALVPKQLAAGEHLLSLRIVSKDGSYTDSAQNVTVWIPSSGQGDVLVALTSPGEPIRILSDTVQRPPQDRHGAPPPPALAIRSAEVEGLGSFFATGFAPAGAKVLLYLNNAFVASVTASADNQWSLKVEKGMRPGGYTIRADQVDRGNGRVIARAEAPFNYPPAPRLAQNQSDPPASPALPVGTNRAPQTKAGLAASLSSGSPVATAPAKEASPAPAKTAIPLLPQSALALAASAAQPGARVEPVAPTAASGSTGRPAKQPESQTLAAPVRTGRVESGQIRTGQAQSAPTGQPQSGRAQTGPLQGGQTAPAETAAANEPALATQASAPQQLSAPQLQALVPDVSSNVMAMATESDTKADAVVKELGTALVERGDSLWRISRKVYGRGMRYTQIYEANAVQIRNPDLIYPGQIFVVPNSMAN